MIDVSIIIVSYKSIDEILANIESIKNNITSLSYEILVVNNYVEDSQLSVTLNEFEHVRVIEAKANLGFGRANNLGLKEARGKYILFANPDIIFLSDINELIYLLERDPCIGLIGPATFTVDRQVLPSCGEYPSIKNLVADNFFLNHLFPKIKWWGNFSMKYFDFKKTREVDWISGAFMLGKKTTFELIDGFDKDFFMYSEDVDLCWRLKKAGFKIVFSDKASIIHNVGHAVENKSINKARFILESSEVLWRKHYNPHTVKKLFVILCLGSILRKVAWQVLNLIRKTNNKNMINYYKTIISGSKDYIKG